MGGRVATFSKKQLREEILREGRILGLHLGAVEMIADRVILGVEKWTRKRAVVTREDLNRRVAMELKKYNADLAYVYENRGKII